MNSAAALRLPMRAPIFSLVVMVLTAAVVVVNAAAFSAIHALRWSALPYADAESLVDLRAQLTNFGMVIGLNTPLRETIVDDRSHFSGAIGYTETSENEHGRPWHVTRVTPNFNAFLGVIPVLGRPFGDADGKAGAAGVILLSDATWRSRYGADSAVIGRTIRFGEKSFEVIGVMPPGFAFPDTTSDAWLPHVESPAERAQAEQGNVGTLGVLARRMPGVSTAEAENALEAIFERDPALSGMRASAGLKARVVPWRDRLAGEHERALVLFQLAAFLLLAVVISNLSSLELDRLIARIREFEIRRTLGATDSILRRELVLERLPAVVAGLALGLCLTPAALLAAVANDLLPTDLPQGTSFGWPAALVGAAVAACALLAPAVVSPSRRLHALNRAGIGGLGRRRSTLLVAQITLTTALLGTTALLLQSAVRIVSVDPGFDPDGVVLTNVDPAGVTLGDRLFDPIDTARYRPLVERIREDVATLPGVDRVAVASAPPFTGSEAVSTVRGPSGDRDLQARQREVGIGYFEALGIPLLAGRDFAAGDPEGTQAVIVDEVYRDRYLGGVDPLSQYVEFPKGDGSYSRARIVGVARTVRHHALDESADLATLYTLQSAPQPTFWLAARTRGNPRDLAEVIRRRVLESDPDVTIVASVALTDRVAKTLQNRQTLLGAIGTFAGATLTLSMLGLATVLGFAARRRTGEIGMRMALGATPSRVRNLVLRQGAALVGVGLALGLVTGLALARLLADRLFGVAFTDGTSWSTTLCVVAGIALLACWWPAHRAALVDPVVALRRD